MKKTIAIIAAAVVVIAACVGIYFGFFAGEDAPEAEIAIYKDNFTLSDATIDTYLASPERYQNVLSVSYGMGDELSKNFFAEPENWLAFDYIYNVENLTDKSMTVIGYRINNNGENGVYASSSVGGKLTLSPRAAYPINLSVLCNDGDLSLEEAKSLVEKLDVELIYGETVGDEADIAESKTAVINEE